MNKVLIFTAAWCAPCKMYKAALEKDGVLPNTDISVYDVDIHDELGATYTVRAVPTTIVLDASGAEIERILGPLPSSKIRSFLVSE